LIYSEPVTIECLQKEAYKTMNALLNKTQQLVRIGTWESDFVNHITTWSPVLKEIMEVPENFDPTLEDTLVFFKDDATREMIIKLRKDSMESGIPFDIEVYMVTAKGKTIRVRALGQTEFVNGRYVKAYGVFQDITKMS
jgi:PAS domain-containing protein